jgi:hypothetical protein
LSQQPNGLEAIHLAIDAGDAAQQAADELIAHAEELISSMQALRQDPSFTFAAQSSDQGASLTPTPVNTPSISRTESQNLSLSETERADNFVHTPDPFRAREEQRRRTRARRATEVAAKVRRSQRLAAKQEAKFVSMLEVDVKKKAATRLICLRLSSTPASSTHQTSPLLTSTPCVLSRASAEPRTTSF